MRIQINRRILLFIAAGLLAAVSCTTLFPGPGDDSSPSGSISQSGSEMDCERFDYPCSLAETDPAALARSGEVMELAESAYLERGSMVAAGERLAQEGDVVELGFDDTGLWYRVEGAPPMWLWDYDDIEGTSSEAESAGGQGVPLARPAPQDSGPVGEQKPGQEPTKRALLLLPWAFSMTDDSSALAGILGEHRNYECGSCIDRQVTRQDPREGEPDGAGYYGPSLARFSNWTSYDLLYIFSHGRQWCGLPDEESGGYFIEGQSRPIGDCAGMLTTGRFRESIFDDASTLDTPGVAWGHKPGDDWWIEALSPDFFRARYGGGLQDSIVFFNTCQLLSNDSFSSILAGDDTAVIGWTQSVRIERGVATANTIFRGLVEDGLRVEKAFAKATASDGYNTEDTYAGAELDVEGDQDARAIEVITWMHPVYEQEVDDIGSLPVEGIPDDGQPDQVLARLRVDGIDDDQDPGSFEIHLKIGDRELDETLTPTDKVGEYRYEVTKLIDLGYDVTGREQLNLEGWIELPESGQTRHFLEDQNLASCGWTGTLSGAQSGDIGGDIALNLADAADVDPAQLQALVEQGLMQSVPNIPELGGEGPPPDMIFLTGENSYPALAAPSTGGAFLLQSLERIGFPTSQQNALSFSEQSEERFAGSINATLLDPISQQNIAASADFIWNAGSFCDLNLILEAAKRGAPDSTE